MASQPVTTGAAGPEAVQAMRGRERVVALSTEADATFEYGIATLPLGEGRHGAPPKAPHRGTLT